jgi:hypothetical protein
MRDLKIGSYSLFPRWRFDTAFPLPVWFAGLWFYLKSFLYFCYVYVLGLEPPPYGSGAVFEILYFGLTMIPCFAFGLLLWNRRLQFVLPAIIFLGIDTPVLFYHVLRLGQAGYLESGLTKVVEFGSLGLNVMAFGWLLSYFMAARIEARSRTDNK